MIAITDNAFDLMILPFFTKLGIINDYRPNFDAFDGRSALIRCFDSECGPIKRATA
jgi:hypothetical protein